MFDISTYGVLKLWKGGSTKNRQIPDSDLDRIMRASSADDRAIWTICVETGYRIEDILHLRQWQVPKCASGLPMAAHRGGLTEPPRMTISERKTGKVRTTELTEKAVEALQWSLDLCPERHPFKYLFPARLRNGETASTSERKGKAKIHRSTVHRHFKKAVKRAGLSGKGYTIHSLRKVYARRLYSKTQSLLAVQRDMGHTSIATTMLYVSDINL